MKDNFQDRLDELLKELIVGRNWVSYSEQGKADHARYKALLFSLLKDYIGAHCPESMPLVIMGRQDYSEYPIAETAYKYALQQYKSNLLEGLSDE